MNCKRINAKARAIISCIRALNLPQRVKTELLLLWFHSRHLVESVIGFIMRHNSLGEYLVLGAVVPTCSHTSQLSEASSQSRPW